MTNREWIKDEINKMMDTDDNFIVSIASKYCAKKECRLFWCDTCTMEKNCDNCRASWLNAKRENIMPELKAGMFIEYKGWSEITEQECIKTGVIVPSEINQLRVVNSNGDWSWLNDVIGHIVSVYDASVYCFHDCLPTKGNHYLWRKLDE